MRYQFVLVVFAVAIGLNSPACGQTTEWTGAAGNNLWSDPGNWSNGLPTATGQANFGGTGQHVVDLGAGASRSVGTVNFATGLNGDYQLINGTLDTPYIGGGTGFQTVIASDVTTNAGGTIVLAAGATITGSIKGDDVSIDVASQFTLSGVNTYTGTNAIRAGGGLGAIGNGSIRQSPLVLVPNSAGLFTSTIACRLGACLATTRPSVSLAACGATTRAAKSAIGEVHFTVDQSNLYIRSPSAVGISCADNSRAISVRRSASSTATAVRTATCGSPARRRLPATPQVQLAVESPRGRSERPARPATTTLRS